MKIRPTFLRLRGRTEAHICIAFVAYIGNKELERIQKIKQSVLSPLKIIAIAKPIYVITIETPLKKETMETTLILNKDQAYLVIIFEFKASCPCVEARKIKSKTTKALRTRRP